MSQVKTIFAKRITVARTFFIISALYGLLLRLYHVIDLPIVYKSFLQAHSHITFLGWGFLAVTSIIIFVFFPEELTNSVYLKRLFTLMTATLFGMLVSFPLQGYKFFSILFLTIFLVTSYFYLYAIYKKLECSLMSVRFIKTGIIYYFISSLAIWAVAIITSKFGKTDLYFNAVYFYLHFLYNGFFVFVLFGLLVRYIEKTQTNSKPIVLRNFYWLTNIAVVPAYALSLLWNVMPSIVYGLGIIAVVLQLFSLYYLFIITKNTIKFIETNHIKNIFSFVIISYFLKIFLQFLSAFPNIVAIALTYKSYFVIGYLHLYSLGFMSMFIILLLKLHPKKALNITGINLLMTGILLSELLLFIHGSTLLFFEYSIPHIKWTLIIASALMPIGLLIVHIKLLSKK